MTVEPDPVMVDIAQGIELRLQGDLPAARTHLEQVWERIGGDAGSPLHRCALAHSLADAQDDPADELRWDERALVAAGHVTDEQTEAAGMAGGAAALFPSLHLNLALCHEKLGRPDHARDHATQCRSRLGALPDDEYGAAITSALDELEQRLVQPT